MTPDAKARQKIDEKPADAGGLVQDMRQPNLGAGIGIAVREHPTGTGPAVDVLFVDREPVGVNEAKPDNTILTCVEDQTARYAGGSLKPQTLRRRLAEQMPALPARNLRDGQVGGVTGLAQSLALNKPRALVLSSAGGRGQLNKEARGAGKPGLNLQQVAAVLVPAASAAVPRRK